MKALVADDDELMRALYEAMVAAAGHEVVAAADGVEAWAAFERDRPELVVLDWHMPGLDGLEVCRRIREAPAGRAAFLLVITARQGEDDLDAVLDAGADDYVSKPVTPEQLRARLVIAERRIRLEAQRRAAEEQLARAQWLAGIGQTTLALEHEINNPLAAVLGQASLLAADGDLSDDQRAQLRVILEQTRRAADVVKRLARLKDPRAVEYLAGSQMIDLSEDER